MASKSHKTESIALRISLYVLWFSQKNSKHTTLAHAKTPQRSPKKTVPMDQTSQPGFEPAHEHKPLSPFV